MANFSFEGFESSEKPKARKVKLPAILGAIALFLGGEASAQQAQGRPITQAQFEATLSPEERALRRAYEERERTDPVARAAAIARERRQAQAQRDGETYCRQIEARIENEGYAKVERDIGGMGLMDCGLD
ncbi:MAG: hypothetical protein WC880_00710 [Candidatus Paceibacterota bacterium]